MTGDERRRELFNTIRNAQHPISGSALAAMYHVSRQVIVQDIALLRTTHPEIYSTSRGYRIAGALSAQTAMEQTGSISTGSVRRVFHVSHSDAQIEDELTAIVDVGGSVIDVFVEHEVYGAIRGDLSIQCRRHVQQFMVGIRSGQSSPLKNLTSGIHYHTVEADSEETLDLIEAELRKKGFLIEE